MHKLLVKSHNDRSVYSFGHHHSQQTFITSLQCYDQSLRKQNIHYQRHNLIYYKLEEITKDHTYVGTIGPSSFTQTTAHKMGLYILSNYLTNEGIEYLASMDSRYDIVSNCCYYNREVDHDTFSIINYFLYEQFLLFDDEDEMIMFKLTN